jgi:O-antigen ligase
MDGGAWLNSAALLLEGVALAFAVRHVIARNRSFLPALLRVMVVAAVGTAILSLSAAAGQATIDAARAGRDELRIFNGPRLSVHTPKTNTAASSFVLFLPIALGLGLDKFRTRRTLNTSVADTARGLVAPVLGATGLFAALWITGSRSGLVAVLVVAVVAAGTWIAGSLRGRARLLPLAAQITVLAVTATVVGFGVYQKAWSIPKQASLTVAAVRVRQLGLLTSVRMLRESPWFGVGIGRYYVESRRVTPEAIEYRMERPFNAHNQFLQVAAELGVVGLVLFTGFIGVVCYRAWIAFRRSRDHLLGAVLAGLGAFLITSLVGQPLLIEVVAYPFWLVLGVALAYGEQADPLAAAGGGRVRTLISIGFLLVLAVSVPIRASKALDRVDLSAVAYGFSAPGTGADGVASRMVRGQGTFFLKADVRRLDLPLMRHQPGSDPLTVELFLDGKRASWVSLSSDRWETMTVFILPKDEIRYRRIDLKIAAASGADPVARVGTPGTSQTRW